MYKNKNIYFLDWLEKNSPFTKQAWVEEMSKSGDVRKEDILKNTQGHLRNAIDIILWKKATKNLRCTTEDLRILHTDWKKFYDRHNKHYNIFFSREKITDFKIIPEIDKIIQFE